MCNTGASGLWAACEEAGEDPEEPPSTWAAERPPAHLEEARSKLPMETQGKGTTDGFEMYQRMYRAWLDVYSSCARAAGGFPASSGVPGFGDWTRMYQWLPDMTKGVFPFFDYVKQWNEDLARAINSTIRTYDAWLKGLYAIAGEGYEMNRKMGAGEEVDVNRFIKAWRNAYDGITGNVVEALKETPFAGLKNVDRAVKRSLDSMPAEQEMVRDLFSQIVHLNAKLMNVLSSAVGEGGKRFSHMMEQGTIKGNGYESAVQTYSELLNDYIGISRVSAGLPRAGRAMEEDVTT
ncbi:MAG: hypothetical protein HYY29_00460, partial [Chloroflexi bacterium]|nr:hypothetical protein [Chloroflexota bacterium]